MPLIEVDQEVWDSLQEKARPLGITSNDVLRTVLKIKSKQLHFEKPPKDIQPISPKDTLTQEELIPHIIKALKENGGAASKKLVERKIFQSFKSLFEQPYYQQKVSRGVPRWQHNIAWAKERAKHIGLIESSAVSGRGIWKLTEKGYNK